MMPITPRGGEENISDIMPIPKKTNSNNNNNNSNDNDETKECIDKLKPLTENLATSLTCSICLEHMQKARQLQCGHLFCADCVIRILRMPKVRCALCKQKTGKRMIRVPQLPFTQLVQGLHVLERLIEQHQRQHQSSNLNLSTFPTPNHPHQQQILQNRPALKDGFHVTVNQTVGRFRNEKDIHDRILRQQQQQQKQQQQQTKSSLKKKKSSKQSKKISNVANRDEATPTRIANLSNTDDEDNSSLHISPSSASVSVSKRRTSTTSKYANDCKACILCPKKVANYIDNPTKKEINYGRWMKLMPTNMSLNTTSIRWVHENCAMYSEDVYAVDNDIVENVDRLLHVNHKCANNNCEYQTNATIRCWHSNCQRYYHYECAALNGCILIDDGYRMFCPYHVDHAPRINDDQFLQALSSENDPETIQHEDFCYLCHTGGRLLMCDTCPKTTHPACSGLRRIPIGEWKCGVCTGIHDASQHTLMHSSSKKKSTVACSSSSRRNQNLSRKETTEPIQIAASGPSGKKVLQNHNHRVGMKRARSNLIDNQMDDENNGPPPSPLIIPSPLATATLPISSAAVPPATPLNHGITSSTKRSRRSTESGGGGKRMVVVSTGLNEEQKETFQKFAKTHRMIQKDDIEERVTHVIIGTKNCEDKTTRTMKLCKAVAKKLPIVCWSWVLQSISSNELLPIDDFIHSVTRKESESDVFQGLSFVFSTFSGDKKKRDELCQLTKLGGGRLLQRNNVRKMKTSEIGNNDSILFVRNDDQSKSNNNSASRQSKSRFDAPAGATVIPYTWILDQITQRKQT